MAATTYPLDVLERAARIKLFGFDVDGTLTDGQLHYGTDGHEAKSFHVQDGMGFTLLRHAGIVLALVTARISPVVEAWKGVTKYAGLTAIGAFAAIGLLHHLVTGANRVSEHDEEAAKRLAEREVR